MDSNQKNLLAFVGFFVVFLLDLFLSNDILQALLLGLLIAVIIEILGNKIAQRSVNDVYHHPPLKKEVERRTKINEKSLPEKDKKIPVKRTNNSSPTQVSSSTSKINWKAIFAGLIFAIIFAGALLFTPPPNGETVLSDEASMIFSLLLYGIIFLGGIITGYIVGSNYTKGLINGVIYTVILGLLMSILSPLMLIFAPVGLIGAVVGVMIKNLFLKLKNTPNF